jgi:soluble lytic murein transglycosylase-like protein
VARNAARGRFGHGLLDWLAWSRDGPFGAVGRMGRARGPRRRSQRTRISFSYRALELFLVGGLLATVWLALLGWLAGSGQAWVLTAGVGGIAIASALLILPLERLRARASRGVRHLLNLGVLAALLFLVWRVPLGDALDSLNELVASERATEVRVIRHQVYAAYRRMNLEAERKVLERAEVFAPTIEAAARAFEVDPELLVGIAAAESSFYPRDSRDGGRGLFQITAVPPAALAAARRALGGVEIDALNQRHNAFLAAATLATYREQMHGDLFLTLLAYNIGPRNGGLETAMKQYGARNFAQVQPYLQNAPRDYPVRVLAGALAYRVWLKLHALPRFEEADAARQIQRLGIPGLDSEPSLLSERSAAPREGS